MWPNLQPGGGFYEGVGLLGRKGLPSDSLLFSYFFLVPAALKFFIAYGSDVVEPFWSFDQYFDFLAGFFFFEQYVLVIYYNMRLDSLITLLVE